MWKQTLSDNDLVTLKAGTTRAFNLGTMITFDTETKRYETEDGERQELYNFDFYDGLQHYTGHSHAEIIETITELKGKYKQITIIAHNWIFDLKISGLIRNVLVSRELAGLHLTRSYIANNIIFARFSSGSSNNKKFKTKSHNTDYYIQILDSFNYFKTSLRELVKAVGLHKYAEIGDYQQEPEIWNYYIERFGDALVKEDTKGLYEYFKKFIEQDNIVIGVTLPDTAMRTFKKNYLKTNIELPVWVNNVALESYRGGRVEPYILCKNQYLYCYDVNSLYPTVMSQFKYSTKFKQKILKPELEEIITNIREEKFNYLLNVNFDIWTERSPILVKDNNKKKLIQTTRERNMWLTGREVLALYEEGSQITINEALEFENGYIFNDYVKDFYELKKNATSQINKDTAKLLLNGLYGKFGQHKEKTVYYSLSDFTIGEQASIKFNVANGDTSFNLLALDKEGLKGNPDITYFAYGDVENEEYFITTNERQQAKYPVIIATEVTANARLYLWKLQKEIGYKNVVYSDTDSLFSPLPPVELPAGLIGKELGQLKVEKEGIASIYGNKDYEILQCCQTDTADIGLPVDKRHFTIIEPMLTVNKGIPKRAVYNWIEDRYEFEQFEKIKVIGKMDEQRIKKRSKRLKRKPDKLSYKQLDFGIPLDLPGKINDFKAELEANAEEIVKEFARKPRGKR